MLRDTFIKKKRSISKDKKYRNFLQDINRNENRYNLRVLFILYLKKV